MYKPEQDLVTYRPSKGRPDSPAVLEWTGAEFVGRMAALIPPARKHLVRYYGALGPRSPLRRAVSMAARGKVTTAELEAGYGVTLLGSSVRAARKAGSAARRIPNNGTTVRPGPPATGPRERAGTTAPG